MFNDVKNQQDATTFSFINIFKSAQHVSGDKFAHSQQHFLTVYAAFGTMNPLCCRPVPTVQPWHRSAAEAVHCTKSCIYSQKVLLRMGEFIARNILCWFKNINKRKSCCILVVYIVVLTLHGHTIIEFNIMLHIYCVSC